MFLIRLVYTSTISEGFDTGEIEKILESARVNNAKNSVTGLLCFDRNLFLQCLEGSRTAVNQTYHKILNDPRHSRIIMLDYKEIIQREFSQWTMGYIPQSSLTKPINIQFSGTPEFNPYEMSGESAHQLMLTLKDVVPNI